MDGTTTKKNETTEAASNGKTYAEPSARAIQATGKTSEELALENAHAELIATARMCEKMTAPKLVKGEYVERNITRHNLEAMGGSAIEALATYFKAYRAFELSVK